MVTIAHGQPAKIPQITEPAGRRQRHRLSKLIAWLRSASLPWRLVIPFGAGSCGLIQRQGGWADDTDTGRNRGQRQLY